MGFFDSLGFDDEEEEEIIELQMTARSRQEAIELTGDDTYYIGDDDEDDE